MVQLSIKNKNVIVHTSPRVLGGGGGVGFRGVEGGSGFRGHAGGVGRKWCPGGGGVSALKISGQTLNNFVSLGCLEGF